MAWINHKTNHGYSFTVDDLPAGNDPRSVITEALTARSIAFSDLKLDRVDSWKPAMQETMLRWLLQFKDPGMHHLQDPKQSFSLFFDEFHEMFLRDPIRWLEKLVEGCELWKFEIKPTSFYECWWDDFLFYSPESALWLHFGVAD